MSTRNPLIPTSCTEANVALDRRLRGEHSGMSLKSYKILKSLVVSLAVLAFAAAMILAGGADPTLTAVAALALVAVLNGIELSEYLDAVASIQEARALQAQDDDSADE